MNKNDLTSELNAINNELYTLPEGKLLIYPNGNWYRWYYINNSARQYLSKENFSFAANLVRKEYLLLKRDIIIAKINAINEAETPIKTAEKKLIDFLQDKRYQKLLKPFFSTLKDTELLAWQNAPYDRNTKYSDQLTYQCPSGNVVRSKSEIFIDMVLSNNGIPYRYEYELIIGNAKFYPDFTLMHPVTGKLIYWEHLGMMDNVEYTRQAFSKLQTYQKHNIIPGENLILTFESKNNPFSYTNAQLALKSMNLGGFPDVL